MNINDKPREECAVFGVSVKTLEAAGITYNGLLALQHRGQEGSGIAVIQDNAILYHKNVGLVSEVFNDEVLSKLPHSNTAIGHNRYSTTGNNTVSNVQPFITEYLTGRIATVHNGNITNAKALKEGLQTFGVNFKATSDSEVISALIAYYTVKLGDTVKGVIKAASTINGAFSLIVLCGDGRLIALRDGSAFRPLCIGKNQFGYCVASESCALDSCGFDFVRDVQPGEIMVFENGEMIYNNVELEPKKGCGLCIFEYVYFSRPDSLIDNLSVYEARYNMGQVLAKEHPVDADAVCGVPDSGLEAAIGYSAASGIPLVSGFVKNRYIGRSFIYPTQIQRESAVRLKLNPLTANVKGKSIILVDDSIVRGTTSKKIVQSMKHAGAKEVHMRISSPPFCYACHYGTDIDSEENLIANKMDLEEIRKEIGADSLGYISIEGLVSACGKCNLPFCTKCFTGSEKMPGKDDLEK
ncbi:MAG: amidophosphoribosyltransferase [Oscillospiraceae bacterium]|jgi:amidophosphoribosyltransferase|nr:amidophosphoribosyltransferase [Oscillospiraceae bacterium]